MVAAAHLINDRSFATSIILLKYLLSGESIGAALTCTRRFLNQNVILDWLKFLGDLWSRDGLSQRATASGNAARAVSSSNRSSLISLRGFVREKSNDDGCWGESLG